MKHFIYLTIFILCAGIISATTIMDCKNAGTQDCVVNESSSVSSSQSPFIFDSLTINPGVTITVSADSGWGYAGGRGGCHGGDCTNTFPGNGGGKIQISADEVTIHGIIRANGADASRSGTSNEGYGGSGGGAGGGILVYSNKTTLNGYLEANGGDGGPGYYDGYRGGGGSSGTIWLVSNDLEINGLIETNGGRYAYYTDYFYGGSSGRNNGGDGDGGVPGTGKGGGAGGGGGSGCDEGGGGGGGLSSEGKRGGGPNAGCDGDAYGGDGGNYSPARRNMLTGAITHGDSDYQSGIGEGGYGWRHRSPEIAGNGSNGLAVITYDSGGEIKKFYNYTADNQSFVVPAGVNSISVKLWGAGGGGAASGNYNRWGGSGGSGAYVWDDLSVSSGQNYTIIVGGGGEGGRNDNSGGSGGFNGGTAASTGFHGGGGGATTLMLSSSVILEAGGGGGAKGDSSSYGEGGAGGGIQIDNNYGGKGGSTTAGGEGSGGNITGSNYIKGKTGDYVGETTPAPNSGFIASKTGGKTYDGIFDISDTSMTPTGSPSYKKGMVIVGYDNYAPIENSQVTFQRYSEDIYSANANESGVAKWSGWDLSTGYVIEITGVNSSGLIKFIYNGTSGPEVDEIDVNECISNGATLFGFSYGCDIDGNTLELFTTIAPRYNNFSSNMTTTNFSESSNLTAVTNVSLTVSGKGRIKFPENHEVNANNQDYDRHVAIGPGYISVNSSGLDSSFNSTATLTFYNADCNSPYVYYSENATTLYGVLGENNLCTAPKCTNIQCSDGVLTVGVSSFSSFAVNGSANLTIDTDAPKSLHELVSFNATYLNSTGFITGATCNISFSDTSAIMDEQPGYYNYSRTFSSGRDLDYMVTCNKSGENTVSAEESFYIYPTGVPEFNLLTLGLGLAVILAGLFLIRKKK